MSLCFVAHWSLTDGQTCLVSPQAITHDASGGDIEWREIDSHTYATTVVMDVSSLTFDAINTKIRTRLFNDSFPSQLIRMRRGRQYQITAINALGPESQFNPTEHNQPKDPNTTNIHTHGLHIGGQAPGDNVFLALSPGEQHTYIYNIPCEHSGGLFWWHPHHHGSSHIQIAAGAAGPLIVEDDAEMEGLPAWYTEMEELVFFISHMHLSKLETMTNYTWDFVYQYEKIKEIPPFGVVDNFFVNGQFQPSVCMAAGAWIKFRIGQIETTEISRIFYIGHGECTLYLLARDGVMVHGMNDTDMPRSIGHGIWLSQSSRADVAVSCPGDVSGTARYPIWVINDSDENQTIAYINVTGTATSPLTELTSFSPIRPSYLENLMPGYYEGDLPHQQYLTKLGFQNWVNLDYWSLAISGAAVGGEQFHNETSFLTHIEVNTINTWQITNLGNNLHPTHIHVNHFQMINSSLDSVASTFGGINWVDIPYGFQEPGDWMDTVWGPSWIRFKTDVWAGTVTVHCHILIHEDQGAMGTVQITNGCDNDYQPFAEDGVCDYVDTCGQFANTTTIATTVPSTSPSDDPTQSPSNEPSNEPTTEPTNHPSSDPSSAPTTQPTATSNPSTDPSVDPTTNPSVNPTLYPTAVPTSDPTRNPLFGATYGPTLHPSNYPTLLPIYDLTNQPSTDPSDQPTLQPSHDPSQYPSTEPTYQPSTNPTANPTEHPTEHPTDSTAHPITDPTANPTTDPTLIPSSTPTTNPSTNPSAIPIIRVRSRNATVGSIRGSLKLAANCTELFNSGHDVNAFAKEVIDQITGIAGEGDSELSGVESQIDDVSCGSILIGYTLKADSEALSELSEAVANIESDIGSSFTLNNISFELAGNVVDEMILTSAFSTTESTDASTDENIDNGDGSQSESVLDEIPGTAWLVIVIVIAVAGVVLSCLWCRTRSVHANLAQGQMGSMTPSIAKPYTVKHGNMDVEMEIPYVQTPDAPMDEGVNYAAAFRISHLGNRPRPSMKE